MKKFLVWFLPIMLLLGWIRPAQAAEIEPVEGTDYWHVNCGEYDGMCVRIAPNININTPRLAEKLGTTQNSIREANRLGTIALCHRPGDGYHMGKVNSVEDRGSDAIWLTCPDEKEQYVYVLPGQVIKIPKIKRLSFNEEQRIKNDLKTCRTAQCAVDGVKKLGAQIEGTVASPEKPVPPPASAPSATPAPREPSQGDKLLVELQACSDDACKLSVLERNQLGLKEKFSPAPPAKAQTRYDGTFLGLIGIAFLAAIGCVIMMYKQKRNFDRALDKQRGEHEEIEAKQGKKLADCLVRITRVAAKRKIPVPASIEVKDVCALLEQGDKADADERKKLDESFRKYFKDFCLKDPGVANLEKLWSVVYQNATETYAALQKAYAELDQAAARANEAESRSKGAALDFENRRQELVQAHQAEKSKLEEELGRARESFRDTEANRCRFGELVPLMTESDSKLRKLDDEITLLHETRGKHFSELYELMKAAEPEQMASVEQVSNDADRASIFRQLVERASEVDQAVAERHDKIKASEARIREIEVERKPYLDRHIEYEALHERLTGFKPIDTQLYEEAQRDRNDAADERARAKQELQQVEAKTAALIEEQRLHDERVARFEEYQRDQQALLQVAREDAVRETNEVARLRTEAEQAQTEARGIKQQAFHIMEDLLGLMGKEGLEAEAFLELKGPSGILREVAQSMRELKEANQKLASDQEAQQADCHSARAELERSRVEMESLQGKLQSLQAEFEQAKTENAQLAATIGEKQAEIDQLLAGMPASEETIEIQAGSLKPPPPPHDLVPVSQEEVSADGVSQVSGMRRRTLGYDDQALRPPAETPTLAESSAADEFFAAVRRVLSAKNGDKIAIDSTRKVWMLYDLTRLPIFRFALGQIFPEGLPPNLRGVETKDKVQQKLLGISLTEGPDWFIGVFQPNRPTGYPADLEAVTG